MPSLFLSVVVVNTLLSLKRKKVKFTAVQVARMHIYGTDAAVLIRFVVIYSAAGIDTGGIRGQFRPAVGQ